MNAHMGLYDKYFVYENVEGLPPVLDAFVLEPIKDKAAVIALLVYANEVKETNEQLSKDLLAWLARLNLGFELK